MLNRNQIIGAIIEGNAVNQRQLQRLLRTQLREIGVSAANLHLLYAIRQHQPVNSRRLAEELGLSRGAIAQVVDQLQTSGLIERQPDESDRRVDYLSLSSQGRDTMDRYDTVRGRILSQALTQLTDQELQTYLALQQKMSHFLSQTAGTDSV